MATIQIADTLHPTRSNGNPSSSGVGGGVYSMRNISRASLDRRSLKSHDAEGVEDEDSGLGQAGDFKKKQV